MPPSPLLGILYLTCVRWGASQALASGEISTTGLWFRRSALPVHIADLAQPSTPNPDFAQCLYALELSDGKLRHFSACATLIRELCEGRMQASDHLSRRSGNLNAGTA